MSQKFLVQQLEFERNIFGNELLVVKNSSPLHSVAKGIEVINRKLEVITTILRRSQEAIRMNA